jgi:hypothetical protein
MTPGQFVPSALWTPGPQEAGAPDVDTPDTDPENGDSS